MRVWGFRRKKCSKSTANLYLIMLKNTRYYRGDRNEVSGKKKITYLHLAKALFEEKSWRSVFFSLVGPLSSFDAKLQRINEHGEKKHGLSGSIQVINRRKRTGGYFYCSDSFVPSSSSDDMLKYSARIATSQSGIKRLPCSMRSCFIFEPMIFLEVPFQ